MSEGFRPWALSLAALAMLAVSAGAQGGGDQPPDEPADVPAVAPGAQQPGLEPAPGAALQRYDDPYQAYASGAWDQALEGFVDQQVERPEEPALWLNIGSAQYQMRDWAEAEKAFARAAMAADPELRAEALYNLGNCAFRQGRLEEAVGRYQMALEANPDDEDAKFNLEFTRNEIRRRIEEAEKRQEQGEQRPPQDEQQQEQQQEQQDGEQGEQGEQGEEQQQEQQPGGADQDGDGLPDEVERRGENPTDPADPDSDDDGLLDGEEDRNRDGGLDPGETDPNDPDSDDDGVGDGEEAAAQQAAASASGEPGDDREMTPEEAARYLDALEEDRPPARPTRERPGGGRPEKDW